jgi:DNA polymerase I-like protein with 3'-5' exonuclease and polymerase domains
MMRRGVKRDPVATREVGLQIIERKMEVDRLLMRVVPQTTIADSGIKTTKLWISSPAQLRFLLYAVWGLREQRDKKTKRPSTGKIALQTLRDLYPRLTPFFDALAESRSLGVIYANCIQSRDEPDGRMHGSFNPAGTETFRWSSSQNAFSRGMNMQNIPAGGDDWLEAAPETVLVE